VKKDDYFVLFKGAKISKREANKVGLGIILGFIGMFVAFLMTRGTNKIMEYIIIIVFAIIGYFWLGNRLFRK